MEVIGGVALVEDLGFSSEVIATSRGWGRGIACTITSGRIKIGNKLPQDYACFALGDEGGERSEPTPMSWYRL